MSLKQLSVCPKAELNNYSLITKIERYKITLNQALNDHSLWSTKVELYKITLNDHLPCTNTERYKITL